jgi:hypothetical protein
MPRKLSEEEADRVWDRLLPRLEPGNALTGYDSGYPVEFPGLLSIPAWYPPEESFLAAIKEAMRAVGDEALFFLFCECTEEEREKGLDWEVLLSELSCQTLAEIGPGWGRQSYLYGTADDWAIFFHHEGVAYCGGSLEFIRGLRQACGAAGVEITRLPEDNV